VQSIRWCGASGRPLPSATRSPAWPRSAVGRWASLTPMPVPPARSTTRSATLGCWPGRPWCCWPPSDPRPGPGGRGQGPGRDGTDPER
jgi:hypothetical protein